MVTINDIKLNKEKFFARQAHDTKTQNLGILSYLDHLSKSTGTNISTWDIESLFKDKTNTKKSLEFIKDRTEINKIFFGEVEKMKQNPSLLSASALKALKTNIEKISEVRRQERKREIEESIESETRSLTEFSVSIARSIAKIAKNQREIVELAGGNLDDKIVADIEEILHGNFYEFLEVNGTTITFVTKNDVINTYIKPSANIDIAVNLGRYKIIFDTNSLAMMVKPYENNLDVNGHCHPNVNSSGSICWGNVTENVTQMLKSFDIKGALLMLASLLSNYTEENSPYRRLASFKEAADAKDIPL